MSLIKSNIEGAAVQGVTWYMRRFMPYLKPDLWCMVLNIAVIICMTLSSAAIIWMVGRGFDLLHNGRFDALPAYFLLVAALVAGVQLLRYANIYLYEWMEQRIIYSIRRKLYSHLLLLSTPFKTHYATGDLLTRLAQDIYRISQLLVLIPGNLFSNGLTLVIYVMALMLIDLRLTLVALTLLPLFWLHQHYFSARTRVSSYAFLDYQGKMSAFEEVSLTNIQGINSFNAEPLVLKRFDHLFGGFRRAAMRDLLLNHAFVVSFSMLSALCAIVLVSLGTQAIGNGELTMGGLVNFLLYAGYLAVPLQSIAIVPVESQIRVAAAARVAVILDTVPSVVERKSAQTLNKVVGRVRFAEVGFSYADSAPVLNNFSLDIQPGEFIAIVGPSGAGKSTLARLLLRFYDPTMGAIYLDEHDLRDLNLASLRSHLAVVWQEPFLLDDTIRANLLLADPNASEMELYTAARDAQAHEFIDKLPLGYDTLLGAQGARLSSGQKQRLAIAQVLLKKSSLLIFDEATSALDAQSERDLQHALAVVRRGRTTIIIAHRYATVKSADRIVYLNSDGSVQVGTHAQLSQHHAGYREALAHQQL